jgi:hypothetical protein
MAKRKKVHKKRHALGPVVAPMPRLFRNDFSEDQRAKFAKLVSADFEKKRDMAFDHICNFARNRSHLHSLSILAAKGLTIPAEPTKEVKKRSTDWISQSDVELLQAICLSVEKEEAHLDLAEPSEIQFLWDNLIELGRGYDLSRMKALNTVKPEDALIRIQEQIRTHTRGIRNWGYYHQVKRIAHDLLNPLDTKFLQHLGFSGSSFVKVIDGLIRENESRINDHMKRFIPPIMKKTLEEMIKSYSEARPNESFDDLFKFLLSTRPTIDEARMIILCHSDLQLYKCFIHDAESVSMRTGVDVNEVESVFRSISISPGELSGRDCRKFLLDNPVWTSPLVLLENDFVFSCIPQTSFSFFFEIISNLVRPHSSLSIAWQNRRASFLEEETAKLFRKVFRDSVIYKNIEWRIAGSGENGETDLLVLVDSLLLIVEAKSGEISAPSKRGAPERLKSEIKELLEKPALQSQRASAAFLDHISGRAPLQFSQIVDISKVKCIIRLSITLDDFWKLQSNIGELQRIGLVSEKVKPIPTISLSSLDTLCELLDQPSMLLHYFHRRSQLEGKFSYDSDEMDLLGSYLMNGLFFGNMENDGSRLVFHKMSHSVDRYMNAISEGIILRKPDRKVSDWWGLILAALEVRKPSRWMETMIAMLDIDSHGQNLIEKESKKLIKKHRKHLENPFLDSAFYIPGGIAHTAVAVVVLKKENYVDRLERALYVAERVFGDPRPQQCVVIGINAQETIWPYNFICMIDRDCKQPE